MVELEGWEGHSTAVRRSPVVQVGSGGGSVGGGQGSAERGGVMAINRVEVAGR